jgi:acetylornithine aminotransferase
MDAVFFCNSGAEANEAAIKLARRYGRDKDIEHPSIVVMENSFHGRTLATLSASGSRKVQAGFEPLVSGFIRAPYDDLEALASIAETNHDVVAVLVEPIQGEGGINVPSTAYLKVLRELCNKHGWLMMLDEVQTGMGRTGRWFAFEQSDIRPDVMALAKGLGNGVPIGACLARGDAAAVFQPGTHGSTFGGNPLACRAADTVIDIIEAEGLSERAEEIGEYLINGLRDRLTNIEGVKEVRGRGLMIGIQLDRPCRELVLQALENRLLINVTAESVVRLLPPLIIGRPEADIILETVTRLIGGFLTETRKDPA